MCILMEYKNNINYRFDIKIVLEYLFVGIVHCISTVLFLVLSWFFDWNTGIGCKICFLFWPLECCLFCYPLPPGLSFPCTVHPSYSFARLAIYNRGRNWHILNHMILENLMATSEDVGLKRSCMTITRIYCYTF